MTTTIEDVMYRIDRACAASYEGSPEEGEKVVAEIRAALESLLRERTEECALRVGILPCPQPCESSSFARGFAAACREAEDMLRAKFLAPAHIDGQAAPLALSLLPSWPLGTRVRKIRGSSWNGRVVGYYRTSATARGYAVESEREPGSVQIYPESALELAPADAPAPPPDAYLVVQKSGYIVGGWQDKGTATKIAMLRPAKDGERVVPVRYLDGQEGG